MDLNNLPYIGPHLAIGDKPKEFIQLVQVTAMDQLRGEKGDWFFHENGNVAMFNLCKRTKVYPRIYSEVIPYNNIPQSIIEKLESQGYVYRGEK